MLPFTVTTGIEDGPTTLVEVAGCHPKKYAGIEVTIKLANAIRTTTTNLTEALTKKLQPKYTSTNCPWCGPL